MNWQISIKDIFPRENVNWFTISSYSCKTWCTSFWYPGRRFAGDAYKVLSGCAQHCLCRRQRHDSECRDHLMSSRSCGGLATDFPGSLISMACLSHPEQQQNLSPNRLATQTSQMKAQGKIRSTRKRLRLTLFVQPPPSSSTILTLGLCFLSPCRLDRSTAPLVPIHLSITTITPIYISQPYCRWTTEDS